MIRKVLLLFACALAGFAQNLLVNGNFISEDGDLPPEWFSSSYKVADKGGPDGQSYVYFSNDDTSLAINVKQEHITLVPGEKYKISAFVKTKKLRFAKLLLGIFDYGWHHEAGVTSVPKDTEGKWLEVSKEITCPVSSDTTFYSFCSYVGNMQGEIALADVRLVPLTDKAKANSAPLDMSKIPQRPKYYLVPASPRIQSLPYNTRELRFTWLFPEGGEERLVASIDGVPQAPVKAKDGAFTLPLPQNITSGRHSFSGKVLRGQDTLCSRDFDFGFSGELPRTESKRYNNLMSEVLNVDTEGQTSFSFVNPREGWVYFKVDTEGKAILRLEEDKYPLVDVKSFRNEAQRYLKAGKYKLLLDKPVSGRLAVRLVPVIYRFASIQTAADSSFKTDFRFHFNESTDVGIEYHRRHAFGVYNSMGPRFDTQYYSEATANGMAIFRHFYPDGSPKSNVYSEQVTANMVARLRKSDSLLSKDGNWVEFDEYVLANMNCTLNNAKAYDSIPNPHGKRIMSWLSDNPRFQPKQVHSECFYRFFNVSGGLGYCPFEAYISPSETEAEARKYIYDLLHRDFTFVNKMFPGANPYIGFIFGNFPLPGWISLNHYVDVDLKYLLDLEMNILANEPEFDGIGIVGHYGCQNADQDINDWCLKLVRHYILEGNRFMLSEKYGYTYNVSFLKNGDFTQNMRHWRKDGNLYVDKLPGFAKGIEKFWGHIQNPDKVDYVVIFPDDGKANELTQIMEGFTPGNIYKLSFIAADFNKLKDSKIPGENLGVDVALPSAEIVKDLCWASDGAKSINVRHIWFKTNATKQTLTIKVDKNRRLLLKSISVVPVFTDL